ncbi:hypothetical protein [Streptoalloteichus hindustanus]|uniref:Uncharacterized protein n=1 Tax=Streptoalloteichus hindustanus TaxID=2017 RepID=A0A1M5GDZ1_STRHI|nr:hypothetical protein [Streptoalloteichus hindustanus]SHG01916.1 hypothetical protein SAMN05444320_10679 [Streptoalloteichus hindustanus]
MSEQSALAALRSDLHDLEARVVGLEGKIEVTRADTAAARTLARAALRAVAEFRDVQRDHTRILDAMRADLDGLRVTLDDMGNKVDTGFAVVGAGFAEMRRGFDTLLAGQDQITDLLHQLLARRTGTNA